VLEAALASLAEKDLVARQRALMNGTRKWLCAQLQKEGRRFIPSEANFVMIDVGGDVKPVIEAFDKRGIRVGRKFPSLGTWLRISIGTQPEIEAFMAAFRDIVPAPRAA
jgi:histidinol-phosphate aminotransferase